MSHRSPAAVLIASALAAVLVSGYAGPALCAAVHGRPVPTEHCSGPVSHGGAGGDSSAASQLTSPGHTVGCPDAAHCGVGITGPVVRRASSFVIDLTHRGPMDMSSSRIRAWAIAPPAPPPKV